MTMFLTFFLLSFTGGKVELQTGGRALLALTPSRVALCDDGSFLIATKYRVYHFNADGSIRIQFGRKGQGPNEYEYIQAIAWNGQQYWVVNGIDLSTTRVNNEGDYIDRSGAHFSHLHCQEDGCWAVVPDEIRPLQRNKPPILEKIDLNRDYKRGKRFHPISDTVVRLSYNWQTHYLSNDQNNLYVMDQLEPMVHIYDPNTNQKKGSQRLVLPKFAEPPEKLTNLGQVGKTEWQRFWYSFSKITGFAHTQKGFLVAYEIPDPEDDRNALLMIAHVARDGKPFYAEQIGDVVFLGVRGEHYFYLETVEDGSTFRQFVSWKTWGKE